MQKIPPDFIPNWMQLAEWSHARIKLEDLDSSYEVHYTAQGNDRWFDGRWTLFLEQIREKEPRLLLMFHYNVGQDDFSVRRFDAAGRLMLRNQHPATLSSVSDVWIQPEHRISCFADTFNHYI